MGVISVVFVGSYAGAFEGSLFSWTGRSGGEGVGEGLSR